MPETNAALEKLKSEWDFSAIFQRNDPAELLTVLVHEIARTDAILPDAYAYLMREDYQRAFDAHGELDTGLQEGSPEWQIYMGGIEPQRVTYAFEVSLPHVAFAPERIRDRCPWKHIPPKFTLTLVNSTKSKPASLPAMKRENSDMPLPWGLAEPLEVASEFYEACGEKRPRFFGHSGNLGLIHEPSSKLTNCQSFEDRLYPSSAHAFVVRWDFRDEDIVTAFRAWLATERTKLSKPWSDPEKKGPRFKADSSVAALKGLVAEALIGHYKTNRYDAANVWGQWTNANSSTTNKGLQAGMQRAMETVQAVRDITNLGGDAHGAVIH